MASKYRRLKKLDIRIILILVCTLTILMLQAPRLVDEYRSDGDFRTFYWMNRFLDDDLFPNDPREGSSYIFLNLFNQKVPFQLASPLYGLVFFLASFILPPILFSKMLAFVLLPICVLYLYQFGTEFRNARMGVSLALAFLLFNLASSSSLNVLSGLQRSISYPLIIPFLYYLQKKRTLSCAIVALLSALIYAPIFVLIVATWGMYILRKGWIKRYSEKSIRTELFRFTGAALLGILMLLPALIANEADSGLVQLSPSQQELPLLEQEYDQPSYNHIWDNPTYQEGGSLPLFFLFPIVGRGGIVEDSEEFVHLILFLAISLLFFLVLGKRSLRIPSVIWDVLSAGAIMYCMAWIMIWLTDTFFLYIPNRYIRFPLFLAFLVYLVWNARGALKEGVTKLRRNPRILTVTGIGLGAVILILILFYPVEYSSIGGFNLKWLLGITGIAFFFLLIIWHRKQSQQQPDQGSEGQPSRTHFFMVTVSIIALLGWFGYASVVVDGIFLNPTEEERALITYVETLPKESLIAGSPCALDNIPLFAKRQVLFNCDLPSGNKALMIQALDVYYSTHIDDVVDFCDYYGIDYLLIDHNTFTDDFLAQRSLFFEPVNQVVLAEIAGRREFVLSELPNESILFQSGPISIIECARSSFKPVVDVLH